MKQYSNNSTINESSFARYPGFARYQGLSELNVKFNSLDLPLRPKKAGRILRGGTRETQVTRVKQSHSVKNKGVSQISLLF